MSLIGFDKKGCPIRYLPFGNMDAKGNNNNIYFPQYQCLTYPGFVHVSLFSS